MSFTFEPINTFTKVPVGHLPERGARVVVAQDRLIGPPVFGIAKSPLLAHPHAVPISRTVDQECGCGCCACIRRSVRGLSDIHLRARGVRLCRRRQTSDRG